MIIIMENLNLTPEAEFQLTERQKNLAKLVAILDMGIVKLGYDFSKRDDLDEVVIMLNSYLAAKLEFVKTSNSNQLTLGL